MNGSVIINAYKFSASELEELERLCGDGSKPWGAPWSCDDLAALRGKIKKHYMKEQTKRCSYCRQEIVDEHAIHWNIDHIVPQSKAPEFSYLPLNLALCCWGCNQAKGDSETRTKRSQGASNYPDSGASYTTYHPHFDDWDQLFYWDEDSWVLIPKDKGNKKARTTVGMCNLPRLAEQRARMKMESKSEKLRELVKRMAQEADGASDLLELADTLTSFQGSTAELADCIRETTRAALEDG